MRFSLPRIGAHTTCKDVGLKKMCHNCSINSPLNRGGEKTQEELHQNKRCTRPFHRKNAPDTDFSRSFSARGFLRRSVQEYISAWGELISNGYLPPSTRVEKWINNEGESLKFPNSPPERPQTSLSPTMSPGCPIAFQTNGTIQISKCQDASQTCPSPIPPPGSQIPYRMHEDLPLPQHHDEYPTGPCTISPTGTSQTETQLPPPERHGPSPVPFCIPPNIPQASESAEKYGSSKHLSDKYTFPDGSHVRVPHLYTVVSKRHLSRVENLASSVEKLQKILKRKKYCSTDLGKRLISTAMFAVPQLSPLGAEVVIPLVWASLLTDAGLIDDKDLANGTFANCAPSSTNITEMIKEHAVDEALLVRKKLEHVEYLFMSSDKGNDRGTNDNSLVKIGSYWGEEEAGVRKIFFDVDGANGTSADVADAIDHTLRKFDMPGHWRKIAGKMTDAGGGGTTDSVYRALKKIDRTMDDYRVGSCSLHGWQLVLKNPVVLTMGEGKLKRKNVLQMINNAHSLDTIFPRSERDEMWRDVTGGKDVRLMLQAVLTRWWLVGRGAKHVWQHWDDWKTFAQRVVNSRDKMAAEIASYLLQTMATPELKALLAFLVVFHDKVWNKHMKWLQHEDEEVGEPGFLSVHMPVRTYLMWKDLTDLRDNWREMNEYNEFLTLSNDITKPDHKESVQEKIPSQFFDAAILPFHDHFDRWRTEHFELSLGGEHATANAIASWIISSDEGIQVPNEVFYSAKHDANIDLKDMVRFLTEKIDRSEVKQRMFYLKHGMAVCDIASGISLRGPAVNENVRNMRKYVEKAWFPLPSSNHHSEEGVKHSNLCAHTGRREILQSAFFLSRKTIVYDTNKITVRERKRKGLKANSKMTQGQHGKRMRIMTDGTHVDENEFSEATRVRSKGGLRVENIFKQVSNSKYLTVLL